MFIVLNGFSPNMEKQQFWNLTHKDPDFDSVKQDQAVVPLWAELDRLTSRTFPVLAQGLRQGTQKLPEVNRTLKTGVTSIAFLDRQCSKRVAAVLGLNLKENKEQLWFNTLAKDPKIQRVSIRHVWQAITTWSRGRNEPLQHSLLPASVWNSYCCSNQSLMETSTDA